MAEEFEYNEVLGGVPVRDYAIEVGTTQEVIFEHTKACFLTALLVHNRTGVNVNAKVSYKPSGGPLVGRWGPRTIPPGETLEIASGTREVMLPGDQVIAECDEAASLDFWVSGVR